MTKDEAIALSKSMWWLNASDVEIALFQIREPRLCMPFDDFQMAVERSLGRSVWTHELADPQHLLDEIGGSREAPTMEEIIAMIPAEKRIVFDLGEGSGG